jgi:hypothetical protein
MWFPIGWIRPRGRRGPIRHLSPRSFRRATAIVLPVNADAVNDWLSINEAIFHGIARDSVCRHHRQKLGNHLLERCGKLTVPPSIHLGGQSGFDSIARSQYPFRLNSPPLQSGHEFIQDMISDVPPIGIICGDQKIIR